MANHKWKSLGGTPVKGEVSRKTCVNCDIQVRVVRYGTTKPHGGWLHKYYRQAKAGTWRDAIYNRTPPCVVRNKCPTCNGSGRVS